jgi:hypothetical protein
MVWSLKIYSIFGCVSVHDLHLHWIYTHHTWLLALTCTTLVWTLSATTLEVQDVACQDDVCKQSHYVGGMF